MQIAPDLHRRRLRQRLEGIRRPANHLGHIHRLRLAHGQAVQPGQGQQVLGDASQPPGLFPDVRDKFPHGLLVDLVVL